MLRLIIIFLIAYLSYQFIKGLLTAKDEQQPQPKIRRPTAGGEDLVEDPYCHTYVPISSACKTIIDGKTFHFCCKKCQEAYIVGQGKAT